MRFDAEHGPGHSLPDHVPDELVARYGASARRTVRGSRSRWAPLNRRARSLRATLRDQDVLLAALAVFAWSVVAAGAVGALVYVALLVPLGALTVGVPLALLLAISLAVGAAASRRRAERPERIG